MVDKQAPGQHDPLDSDYAKQEEELRNLEELLDDDDTSKFKLDKSVCAVIDKEIKNAV
jgi:hypothetical protein